MPAACGAHHNLGKIRVVTFDGTIAKYRSWKADFQIAIDNFPVSAGEKMLRLRDVLSGEPKSLIDDLQAYTQSHYDEALRRLRARIRDRRA